MDETQIRSGAMRERSTPCDVLASEKLSPCKRRLHRINTSQFGKRATHRSRRTKLLRSIMAHPSRRGDRLRINRVTTAFIAACTVAASAHAQVKITDSPASATTSTPIIKVQQVDPAKLSPDQLLMRQAREAIVANKPGEAKALLSPWIKQHKFSEHPLMAEALYLRGNAKLAMNDEYDALYDYEEVANNYAGSEYFAKALEREFDVAKLYLAGRMRPGVLGIRLDSGTPVAEEIIIRIGERLPGSKLAEKALLELADHYAAKRDLRMAVETYDVFVRLFPRSPMRSKAMQRRIYSSVAQFKGPEYSTRSLKDAKVLIEDFASEFPAEAQRTGLNDGLAARLDESAAAGLLTQAQWYVKRDDPVAARLTLTRLIKRHPKTGAAHEGLDLIAAIDEKFPELKPKEPEATSARTGASADKPGTTETVK